MNSNLSLSLSRLFLFLSSVLGVHISVVTGRSVRFRFQQCLVLFGLVHPSYVHSPFVLSRTQTLSVGSVQLLVSVAAALQPAGGRLLHHPGQSRRGEREHVQEHPGERIKDREYE